MKRLLMVSAHCFPLVLRLKTVTHGPFICRILCGALVLSIATGRPPVAERRHGTAEQPPLIELLLQIDVELHSPETMERAHAAAADFGAALKACQSTHVDSYDRDSCLLNALLGDTGFVAARAASRPAESTAASALAGQPSSCAALVAAVLALSEPFGKPFDAVVLRDHVVLGSTESPSTYYEVLEGGRRLSDTDLSKHGGVATSIRVAGDEYVSYYLDNLAARLVEDGEAEKADAFFRRALQRSSRAGRIRYNYGTFLLQQGSYEQAAEQLNQAIRSGWKDALAYTNRGTARWKLGKLKAARRDYRKALALDPRNQLAAVNLRRLEEMSE